MKHYLVIRLSAMGDVAMVVPVLKAATEQNPDAQFTVLTRQAFVPLFRDIKHTHFIIPDLYGRHKGVTGLRRLVKDINQKQKITAVLDLHDILRAKIIRLFFRLGRTKTYKIDKGRAGKQALTKRNAKVVIPLKHSCERYADVFRTAGLNLQLKQTASIVGKKPHVITEPKEGIWIGIAPFAQHKEKMYPKSKMEEVIKGLGKFRVFIFGGGALEKAQAEVWEATYPYVTSLIGKVDLDEELNIMAQLDQMISMDSANMHIAALLGTPTLSIWGATHPFAGFSAFGEKSQHDQIQIPHDKLICRPCSVFGNKPCFRGDWACMNLIEPEEILSKVHSRVSGA